MTTANMAGCRRAGAGAAGLLAVVAALIVAGCDSMVQQEVERATLVGTWEARRAGELLYIARLKDDGTYTFTSPGESEPHQAGNWSYDRATRKLTLGALTFSGIAEEPCVSEASESETARAVS